MNKMHVKRGDTVQVIAGKDKGKEDFDHSPPRISDTRVRNVCRMGSDRKRITAVPRN